MRIEVTVLNVNDADAIILHLTKEGKHLVMLIDGGHTNDSEIIIETLKPILKAANKEGPDVILCTHYDTDHICGVIPIVQAFKNTIGQIFIHRTTTIFDTAYFLEAPKLETQSIMPSESDIIIGNNYMEHLNEADINIILKGINQEKELIQLIDAFGIKSVEPIAGSWNIQDWEEIEIIGPTEDYYKKLFPSHFTAKEFAHQEIIEMKSDSQFTMKVEEKSSCEVLDSLKRTTLTNANLNSAILKITADQKVFLFAADAGIESFYNIPNYKDHLKEIFWLKVPHHGSHNNINSALIKIMKPKIAVISGKRLVNPHVVSCLQSHCEKVDITSISGSHLVYIFE